MRNFILGTDWGSDCDDAVAIRVLLRAHKENKICLKGIGINACMEHSVGALDAFMENEGVSVPIGIDLEATDFGEKLTYQEFLAGFSKKTNKDAIDAVRIYRKIMAEATTPLEIVEIGFLQVMANVLESSGDDISEKTGLELVKEKVSKIWVMAGRWDVEKGQEHNFDLNPRSRKGGSIFCEKCPVPVTFLGWEIGNQVITGQNLKKDDLLYKVLEVHGSANGRFSWDPMLVLMAVIGDEEEAGYSVVSGTASVDESTGTNYFVKSENGLHKYVIMNKDKKFYEDAINKIIF